MRAWIKEEYDYLKENYTGKFNDEIAELMNNYFKGKYRIYTASSISCAKNRIGIKYKNEFGRKYTKEVIDFVINNHKGKSLIELADLVNKKFNLNINNDNLSNLKSALRIRKGIILEPAINDGCLKKGNIPKNKGKKWDEYMSKEAQEKSRKTWFKKGNTPANHREIGEERITQDGYIEIKVRDKCGNDNWELKHRWIYEQHYGKIPEGYNVIFLDGNKKNLDINNLKCITKNQDLIMNNRKLFTKDKDITYSGTLIAEIIDKGSKLKNGRL